MTENQAHRIEILLAAHLAVSTETMVLVSLGTILGGRGVQRQQQANNFMKKAKDTKLLINDVLQAMKDDREQESAETAARVQAVETALEAELKKPSLGFKR